MTSGSACDGATEKPASGADATTTPDAGDDDAAGRGGFDAGAVPDASQAVADSGQAPDSGQDDVADAGASDAGVVQRGTFISCAAPMPVVAGGQSTGLVECGDSGVLHRADDVACPVLLPRATGPCAGRGINPDAGQDCTNDSDCTAKSLGTCNLGSGHFPTCGCSYGCVHDSDCAPGELCQCGAPVGACVPASCHLDSQCPAGSLCASSPLGWGGCSWDPLPSVYACESAADTCLTNLDCKDAQSPACGMSPDAGTRSCGVAQLACPGRPFLVGKVARVAGVVRRGDWSSRPRPITKGLSEAARSRLAAYWTEVAQMEHASVAAFARFALELLALGAPPELLVATHDAMADETEHARLAFSLASAYGLREIGPGPLALDGAIGQVTPRRVFATLVREGCIGETLAAVLATEAHASATDPSVRASLSRIAEDETKHAGLAWWAAVWLLEAGDEAFARWAEAEVARAIAEHRVRGAAEEGDDERLRAHGVLDGRTQQELDRAVLRDLVVPRARLVRRTKPRSGSPLLRVFGAARRGRASGWHIGVCCDVDGYTHGTAGGQRVLRRLSHFARAGAFGDGRITLNPKKEHGDSLASLGPGALGGVVRMRIRIE